METVEDFYNRTSWISEGWGKGRVFVYPTQARRDRDGSLPTETWDIQTAKNYVQYLEDNQPLKIEL